MRIATRALLNPTMAAPDCYRYYPGVTEVNLQMRGKVYYVTGYNITFGLGIISVLQRLTSSSGPFTLQQVLFTPGTEPPGP